MTAKNKKYIWITLIVVAIVTVIYFFFIKKDKVVINADVNGSLSDAGLTLDAASGLATTSTNTVRTNDIVSTDTPAARLVM
jgi:beta-lactamase regulating signal transducer with metallopeptidase domain